MMTQKSGSRTENRFVLRGVEGEARMGEIEINYEELAKYTLMDIERME